MLHHNVFFFFNNKLLKMLPLWHRHVAVPVGWCLCKKREEREERRFWSSDSKDPSLTDYDDEVHFRPKMSRTVAVHFKQTGETSNRYHLNHSQTSLNGQYWGHGTKCRRRLTRLSLCAYGILMSSKCVSNCILSAACTELRLWIALCPLWGRANQSLIPLHPAPSGWLEQ